MNCIHLKDNIDQLKCFYTNANSIIAKMDEFRQRVNGFDIAGVTETRANENIADAELHITGYNLFQRDRQIGRGVGVLLYVSEKLQSALEPLLSESKFEESIWCTITSGKSQLLVGVCYRSDSSPEINNELLPIDLGKAASMDMKHHMMVMGDFNYPEIDSLKHTVIGGNQSNAAKFFDMINDMYLYQHVTEPTRFRKDQCSLLDYVFTGEEDIIGDMEYQVPIGKSDHVCITWKMTLETLKEPEEESKFNFWKGKYDQINQELECIDWIQLLRQKSVEEMWQTFRWTIENLMVKFIPKKKSRRKMKTSWITKNTIKEMKGRSKLWKRYQQTKTEEDYEDYRRLRNKVNNMVRKDQENYRRNLIESFKDRPKKFYGYMRNLQTCRVNVSQLSRKDGTRTSTDNEIAEVLGEYFKDVFVKEETTDSGSLEDCPEVVLNMDIPEFNIDIVAKKLTQLDPTKAPGSDGLHPYLLKECAMNLARPLSMIFQRSFDTGDVPSDWKHADVSPIFKKGSRTDPGNYRPVSLTSLPCKIMETIIKENLLQHLERHTMISKLQHGFTRGRSCLTNLLESFEEWTRALDEGYGVDVIFLDYRKAFDTVPHRKLMKKLKNIGLTDKHLNWIRNFLTSRRMRVRVRGKFSRWFDVTSGVPQGSVLGLLLFLIFVNDLPSWIINSMRLFADDIKIWRKIRSDQDQISLQSDLDVLVDWTGE